MVKTKEKETVKKSASKVSIKKETKEVKKAPAAKKATTTKTPAKKSATKKAATKTTAVKKTTTAKKVPAKKEPAKKVVAKKEVVTSKKKVLFVVSECQPFCATGGLADVAGGLPRYIAKNKNMDIRVMMPLYSDIPTEYRENFKYIGNKNIPLAWRSIYCGVFSYEKDNVTYYFLDNEYYFKRGNGIYSYFDDGERFAFTSKAVLEVLPLIDFTPDIIHCNDWQFALVPVYLKTEYNVKGLYNNIKTVFTCHNTEYQGRFDLRNTNDLFGIDTKNTSIVEYSGGLNLVKGAVVCCDKFTTVSPTYAKEILGPEHSNGLDSILRQNSNKIVGILNGVDYDFYNPQTDKVLYKNYDAKTYNLKKENKVALQKDLGLNVDETVPMLSIVTRMAKHKGLDLIKDGLEGIIANNNVQLIVAGNGTAEYENYFKYLENKYKGKVKACLGYSNKMARKAYAASDIFLMPSKSEPCGISQMIASRYGSVPVVRETGGLKDSIKDFGCQEGGNGYTFANYNTHDLVYSINRALKDYQDKASWEEKIKICMNKDFSWNTSAIEYIKLYEELV